MAEYDGPSEFNITKGLNTKSTYGYNPDRWDRRIGLTDNIVPGKDGKMIKLDGWGGDAMGLVGSLGNMYMQNKSINAQEEAAQKALDFQQESFYKNYAMKMAGYRDYRNNKGLEEANTRLGIGNSLQGADRDKYFQDGVVYGGDGKRQADPSAVGSNGKVYGGSSFSEPSMYNTPDYLGGLQEQNANALLGNSRISGFNNLVQPAQTAANSALAATTPVKKITKESKRKAGVDTVNRKPQANQPKKPVNQ